MAPIVIDATRDAGRYEIALQRDPTPSEIAAALEQASKALNKLALLMLDSGNYTAANPVLGTVMQSAMLTEQTATALRMGNPLTSGIGMRPAPQRSN